MKTVPIDRFVKWAYCEEWPKLAAGAGPADMASAWSKIGAWRVGGTNALGVVEDLAARGLPHPDSLALHAALAELDAVSIDLPDDWEPMADVSVGRLDGADDSAVIEATARARKTAIEAMTLVDRDGARKLRRPLRDLVLMRASMGAPDWRCEPFDVRAQRAEANGKPRWFAREIVLFNGIGHEMEVDGFDQKRQRPKPNAYRKWECAPDPLEALIARAEYEVWWWALKFLVEELEDRLSEHAVVMIASGVRPWETGEPRGPRILPSLAPPPAPERRPRVFAL